MEAQTYTVFTTTGFQTNVSKLCLDWNGISLRELLDKYAETFRGQALIAWAAEGCGGYGGGKSVGALRAESIAAGRLIEFRDGKYIPLGVAEEAPKPIKIERIDRIDGPFFPPMPPLSVRVGATEKKRPPLTWATPKPFDAFKGFFTEPADIADWQDTYFPR